MIVDKIEIQKRQIHQKNSLSKLPIRILLSKNRNRDTLAFTSRKDLDNRAKTSLNNSIDATQEETKKDKPTHKLHSLHPFI